VQVRLRTWRRALWWLVYLTGLLSLASVPAAAQGGGRVLLLQVKGPVTPVVQAYIERGIRTARDQEDPCLVIQLDTPGGSLDITRHIVQDMQASPVPIIVYVAPSGATAASAGTIITLAGNLAAMAPGTSIGAASPVSSQGQDLGETEKAKAENIVIADLKSLTVHRSPEAQAWVEKAVREAAALSADEALRLGVVDVVAADVPSLLRQVDGRSVTVAGQVVTLHTAGLEVQPLAMSAGESLLHTILDPNIAFILMTLGLNGLLFELSSPGSYVPGVIGGICLLLGLFALGVLSVNWAGFGLIVLAFILFVADVKAPTHGVLTFLGLTCFVLGSLVLFNSPFYHVSLALVLTVALFTAGFFAFVVSKAVAAQRRPAVTGREGLLGARGVVRQALAPAEGVATGMVFVQGELWSAEAAVPLAAGTPVRVKAMNGLRLVVEPVEEGGPEDARR
jgi:membrane-bound serine protease (ClpP class)